MAKQVRETSAGKSVSAWVVMNKKGEHVATVNAYFGGTNVSVDVWNLGQSACSKCYKVAATPEAAARAESAALAKRDWITQEDAAQWAAFDLFGMQQSTGRDIEGALSGLIIDGQYLFDHCGKNKQSDAFLAKYHKAMHAHPDHVKPTNYLFARGAQKDWDIKAKRIGASFANWSSNTNSYNSLFMYAGLRRLQELGYTVIQAI